MNRRQRILRRILSEQERRAKKRHRRRQQAVSRDRVIAAIHKSLNSSPGWVSIELHHPLMQITMHIAETSGDQ